jgi:hypothetical protein
MSCVITSFNVVKLNGLVMKKFAPAAMAASACCASELADIMTIGTLRIFGSARIFGHFSSHDPVTDKRSHGTGGDPEGYLFSHLATKASKEGLALVGRRNAATATCNVCLFCEVFK